VEERRSLKKLVWHLLRVSMQACHHSRPAGQLRCLGPAEILVPVEIQ
jgi:hypothetical protein